MAWICLILDYLQSFWGVSRPALFLLPGEENKGEKTFVFRTFTALHNEFPHNGRLLIPFKVFGSE